MGTIGAIIGSLIGSRGGFLGAIIGAVVGNYLGDLISESKNKQQAFSKNKQQTFSENELFILGTISAMFAKLAKADGRISEEEIEYCESAFKQLGITGKKREYCIDVFRKAKSDSHTIYDYAADLTASGTNTQIRQLIYDILWNLACADGSIAPIELEILRNITQHLHISYSTFIWQCGRHGINSDQSSNNTTSSSGLYDPYEILEVSRSASNDELKKAYRDKAKKLHPDILKAQGLSDALIAKANDQMARINAAWDEIKKERAIK